MATWENIVKTSLLGSCKRLALLALLVLASGHPAQATSQPPGMAAASPQATIHLAWDRVGAPIQLQA
jgi:hypothetical protein